MFDLVPFRRNRNEDLFGQMMKSFQDMVDGPSLFPFNRDAAAFRTDIREEKDRYLVEAELPGLAKEDIEVDYANSYLTIRAKRNEINEQKDENNKVIRRERHTGEFVRRFYVDNIDDSQITAKLENGVLKLDIPKRPDNDKPTKRIAIE